MTLKILLQSKTDKYRMFNLEKKKEKYVAENHVILTTN